jgi:hypothetical protein
MTAHPWDIDPHDRVDGRDKTGRKSCVSRSEENISFIIDLRSSAKPTSLVKPRFTRHGRAGRAGSPRGSDLVLHGLDPCIPARWQRDKPRMVCAVACRGPLRLIGGLGSWPCPSSLDARLKVRQDALDRPALRRHFVVRLTNSTLDSAAIRHASARRAGHVQPVMAPRALILAEAR